MKINNDSIVSLKSCTISQGDIPVLRDIDLEIRAGDFVYLVGNSGAGKSSLLKTIYGELPLKKGKGSVTGIPLNDLTWKELPALRRKIGMVFQDFNLLEDRTVKENLSFVLEATDWKDAKEIEERIKAVLDAVKLSDKHNKRPHELSGGEQQRVAIARALLNAPKLILADEPTGNLDPETSEDILSLLFVVAKDFDAAVILATHDYRLLDQRAARVIRLHGGVLYDDLKELIVPD